jgi:deoxyribonuclease-4
MLLLGAHLSIAGGLHRSLQRARKLRCTALQIFTKNASAWRERPLEDLEVERFESERRGSGVVEISSHTSYLLNLASPERATRRRSIEALGLEVLRCSRLGVHNVVLHPGAHRGDGEERGIARIADGLRAVLDRVGTVGVRILLESTAGQGTTLGRTFEQLAAVLERSGGDAPLGVCLDTCHLLAAGYDIRSPSAYRKTLKRFDRTVGLGRLHLLHMNDSKKELGSRVDRHEHIGEGHVGREAFRLVMTDERLTRVPKILETPKLKNGKEYDRVNLNRLRRLAPDA